MGFRALESSQCRPCAGRPSSRWSLQSCWRPTGYRLQSIAFAKFKLRAAHQTSFIQRRNIKSTVINRGTGWSSRVIAIMCNLCYKSCIDRFQSPRRHQLQTKNLFRLQCALFRLISETNARSSFETSSLPVTGWAPFSRTRSNPTRKLARSEWS
jgi:hypothetical protein